MTDAVCVECVERGALCVTDAVCVERCTDSGIAVAPITVQCGVRQQCNDSSASTPRIYTQQHSRHLIRDLLERWHQFRASCNNNAKWRS